MSSSGEVFGRDRQRELIALGLLAAAVAGFYVMRLIAGAEPAVRAGGPLGVPVRPLDRVLIPATAAGLLAAGHLLLRCIAYRPACRMAALAAFSHAVAVAVRPFSLESPLSHALAQSGAVTPWLLVLAVLALPQRRWPGSAQVAAAIGIGFAGLMAAVRVVAFSAASAGDQRWLARHELAGAVAGGGVAVAVATVMALLFAAYRRPRIGQEREAVLWTIGGALVSLPAWLLLRLPAYVADPAAAGGFSWSAGAVADLLLLPLPVFFLVGTQRIRNVDQRRAANRFVATLIVLTVLFLSVVIAGDYPQRQLVDSYGMSDRVAAFLVLGPLFIALFALHALLVRAFDRAGGAGRAPAPAPAPATGGTDGSRGVRDVRMLARALHRSLGGSWSAAAGTLQALESELEAERDRSPQADSAPRRLPRDALDSIRGFRQTALTVLAALRRLDAGTRAGSAVVAVQVSDLFAAAYRRAVRSGDMRVVLTGGGELFVACDPEELARAVAELLLNAEEAGFRPRARITMRARPQGGDVVIEIEDSGGARPLGPARSRVFEPFYSTKPGHDGLGLYISRALVEHNGGSLVLERGTEGTRAVVTLPSSRP